jgi:hypothetical protein
MFTSESLTYHRPYINDILLRSRLFHSPSPAGYMYTAERVPHLRYYYGTGTKGYSDTLGGVIH